MSVDENFELTLNRRIPELRGIFSKLKDKYPDDGDLKRLNLDYISEREVRLWDQYVRFLNLIKKAIDEKKVENKLQDESKPPSEEIVSDAISLIMSEFTEKDGQSYFEGFIRNRVTSISGFFNLKKIISGYDIWPQIEAQYNLQKSSFLSEV